MEPAYPLAIGPACGHGAVELGWPGHLALLLPEVSTQAFGRQLSNVTTTTLRQKSCVSTLQQSRLPKLR
eukprot:3207982-Lingulodinium_polyedra.AAC.1